MNLQHTAPDDVVARLRRSDRLRLGRACAGLAVAVLVLALLRVVWGTYQVTVPDLVRILGGETIPGASFIVLEEKLPRAVAAVLTGAALGAAGALYRRTLRNPLAS
ncbi:iron chelate uptake ABC transporter family permease subunit, partial [Aquicoccus sp. SCR17]|nr:iron chelate uptake ABC transporter family permease subunit [Carideicomes alvinocaridis]